jgi:hypothetical protein
VPPSDLKNQTTGNIMSLIKVVNKYKIDEQPNDFSFWQSKSYEKRIDALEQIRQEFNNWKYNAEQRFQRVYKIIKRK